MDLPDVPACTRKELGEGGLIYQYKKDEYAKLLLENLAVMQANGILTDLTVLTKSKDLGKPFHSMLLAASSPNIKRSLTGKHFDCTSGIISLGDLTQEQLEAFRDFLYKSKLPSSQEMVDDFRQFASRYGITSLEQLCKQRRVQREGHDGMIVWSKHHEDVLSQLHYMHTNKELTTICLEDRDGSTQFAVHGPLIAAASPVFLDMFSDDLLSQEGSSYRLKDVTCITLGDLIEFIYTGKVTLEEENVVDLLHAGCDYEILPLARACCDWLGLQLNSYNAIGIWSLAREKDCEYTRDLEEIAKSYIITNFAGLCKEEEFLELEYGDLAKIIQDDYLGVHNEEEVFVAVVNWIKADENNRSSFFCDLLQCIRLECTSREFLRNIGKDPHVANCSQCLRTLQLAQEKVHAQEPAGWRATERTPDVTQWRYDDEADVKKGLLYEFLESIPEGDDHLKEVTKPQTPSRAPRKSKEPDMRLKQNRWGQCNVDGSPDMRFKVNRRHLAQQNKDGSPDMRFKGKNEPGHSTKSNVCKNTTPAEGPLTKEGKPDMRFKVNKEAYGQSSSQKTSKASTGESEGIHFPVKKDGTPDMRFSVNKTSSSFNRPARKPASPLQASTSSSLGGPLKRDGTPDMRFAVNKPSASPMSPLPTYGTPNGPRKRDGTPDMRYAANKSLLDSPFSSGYSSGASPCSSLVSLGSPGPLKSDGTPDRRYVANRSSYASPPSDSGSSYSSSSSSSSSSSGRRFGGLLKSDGTPDMRYAANRSFYGSSSSFGGSSYSSSSSSSGPSSGGPLKSDGTPDMRYAANRSSYGSSSSYGGSSYSSRSSSSGSSFGRSSSCGPLKSNGTPDMRFKANRR